MVRETEEADEADDDVVITGAAEVAGREGEEGEPEEETGSVAETADKGIRRAREVGRGMARAALPATTHAAEDGREQARTAGDAPRGILRDEGIQAAGALDGGEKVDVEKERDADRRATAADDTWAAGGDGSTRAGRTAGGNRVGSRVARTDCAPPPPIPQYLYVYLTEIRLRDLYDRSAVRPRLTSEST